MEHKPALGNEIDGRIVLISAFSLWLMILHHSFFHCVDIPIPLRTFALFHFCARDIINGKEDRSVGGAKWEQRSGVHSEYSEV